MRRVRASAPGKVILLGEHFVVKGSRALVASIDLRATVEVEPRSSWPSLIVSEGLGASAALDEGLRVRGDPRLEPIAAVLEWLAGQGYSLAPFKARIGGSLPPGAGLGSSAAVGAAFALAYTALHGDPLGPEGLMEASLAGERVVHGNPSGVDPAIAAYGGFLLYRRGEAPRRLDLSLPEGYVVVVADSGIPRRTGDVVSFVLERAEATRPASDLVYRAADELVGAAVEALRAGDAARLGALMDLAHGLLAGLGASSEALERLVHRARGAGALGAKLTGAGWGGSIIALAPEGLALRVCSSLEEAGARWARPVKLGVEGARLEA